MKKLLFTFATLFAALTAGAAIVPTLEFSSSEISVVPGGDAVQVQILLTEDGTAGAMKSNQLQWGMFNAAHEIMETSPAVTLVQTDIADYEEDEEADPDFRYLVPGNVAQKRKFDGCIDNYVRGYYRILCVRMDGKDILTATSAATYAASDPTVWTITIKADANWDEEFATLELASTPEYACMWQDANGASYMNFEEDAPMVLKIKNANYVPPVTTKDFLGDVNVTVDQATGAVTATYVPAEGEDVEPTVVVTPNQLTEYGVQNVTVTVSADGYNTKDYTKEVNWVKPNADFQGTVTVTVDENGNITAVYNPAEGENVTPTVTVNPNKMDTYGTVDVVVTVEAAGYNTKTYNETATWTKPAPKELTGTLTISDHVNGHFTVTYSGDEDVEITCTITKQGAKESTEGYDLPGYGTYDVYAKATATDAAYEGDYVEATKVLVWEAPQPKEFLGTVDVTVDENGNITVAYVPAEDEVVPENMTITYDPTKVTEDGTYTVNYTVSAPGYNDLTGSKDVTYTKPVVPVEQTVAPSTKKDNEIIWDAPHVCHNEYHITLVNNDEDDAVIYYRIGVGTYDEATETWTYEYPDEYMVYSGEIIVTTPGTYMIDAYAIAPNKTESTHTYDGFNVASTTSVEELFADKTLAGVRYFNLAGQEMQEANGICISVYTFTDGTQVAVKVMQ